VLALATASLNPPASLSDWYVVPAAQASSACRRPTSGELPACPAEYCSLHGGGLHGRVDVSLAKWRSGEASMAQRV